MTWLGIAVRFLLIVVVNGCVNEIVEDVLNSPHILRSNSITLRVPGRRTCLLRSRLAPSPTCTTPSRVMD
jgi:hypothetical protein